MKGINNTEMTVDVTVTRSLGTKESRIELIEDLSRGYADAVNNGVQLYIDTCVDARTRADIDRLNASFDRLNEFNR